MAQLTFCGAAGTVTGSCSLVETSTVSFLVDCGLFQGNKSTQALNYEPFPFDPTSVSFLILTHAHIDHSGLLPKLVANGFDGPIYATQASVDLLEFMLRDGASIQESNTARKNKKNKRRGLPSVEPLYTMADAENCLKLLKPVEFESLFEPTPGIEFRFWNAGHILGSASAEVVIHPQADEPNTLRLLFSGDIGPDEKVFHSHPDAPDGFDYIICESTYGNRERDDYTLEARRSALQKELKEGLERGGNVVIPSFAVERSQELLHDIGVLLSSGQIPQADVYLDSPLATKVTRIFIKHAQALDDVDMDTAELFRNERFHLVEGVEESKAVSAIEGGAIIISASGMCDAGRIQHHLKANIWRRESTVLFVGYQSPGTLGHIITSGVQDVRIHGKEFKVRANIRRLGNYSAHADQSELVDWIVERAPIAGGLFLNHGEDDSRNVLRDLLDTKGVSKDLIFLPHFDETFELKADTPESKGRTSAPGRPDEVPPKEDWHNVYAQFSLNLTNRLESLTSEDEKRALLELLAESLKKGV